MAAASVFFAKWNEDRDYVFSLDQLHCFIIPEETVKASGCMTDQVSVNHCQCSWILHQRGGPVWVPDIRADHGFQPLWDTWLKTCSFSEGRIEYTSLSLSNALFKWSPNPVISTSQLSLEFFLPSSSFLLLLHPDYHHLPSELQPECHSSGAPFSPPCLSPGTFHTVARAMFLKDKSVQVILLLRKLQWLPIIDLGLWKHLRPFVIFFSNLPP